jgi:hypothetical protein
MDLQDTEVSDMDRGYWKSRYVGRRHTRQAFLPFLDIDKLNASSGAGKSVLATNLIDELRRHDEFLTLYFFFRDGDSQTMSPLEMVASIIAQLIDSKIDKERLMRLLKLHVESSSNFTNKVTEPRDLGKLSSTLLEMLRGFPTPVIILLDALDECSDPQVVARHLLEPAGNLASIAHLMMMPNIGEDIHVRFLLTGRPNVHDIFAPLSYVSTIDMDVNADIRKFVNEKVADNESLRGHEIDIIATIYENSQGMFRYAGMYHWCDGRHGMLTIYAQHLYWKSSTNHLLNPSLTASRQCRKVSRECMSLFYVDSDRKGGSGTIKCDRSYYFG